MMKMGNHFKSANLGVTGGFGKITPPKTSTSSSNSSTATTTAGTTAAVIGATTTSKESTYPKDCPPDVNELGRSTWTFLHSLAATYPPKPNETQQNDMLQFLNIFSKIYPCWWCAEGFQSFMEKPETKPKVTTQEEFGKWLCDAHNEVNERVGKPKFDCNLWKQRWKDGWEDGSCD
ncbi:FAD-linked sulfhydryl oxidase ALR [Wickerhamomyces ciferrii]|uniref:Sulfhydryl oxidase n=1 Tax=Wickerhamomyces ciferrii (strain ATCC 14091 / BCRC 22168 / CBS 111 / JCM 3599 / NBRC 0793 / NRRL Y-1031 F-60-10) TaxID=1206466 RepID=K0K7L8_WICCF|nr:FAD-linked sulfhydryl oxidase ALR [Wickerhamomyces ciferrii]CCH40805.1 FAD-linked sulfhydryl oxidase ALR [Wickerhamomyces ciferrii]